MFKVFRAGYRSLVVPQSHYRHLYLACLTLITLCVVPECTSRAQVANASAMHYFVDSQSGNDLSVGTSDATPFRTIAKINSLQLAPGTTVSFRAGGVWHETLAITSSGTSGSPITFNSFGTGSQPVITAADTVTGWSGGGGAAAQESCSSPTFCSGFETPAFADWDGVVGDNDATAYIATSPVNHGSGVLAIHTSSGIDTRASVTKTIQRFYAGTQYGFRFYVFMPQGSLKPNNNVRILEALNGGKSVGFASLYTDSAGSVRSLSFYDTADNSNIVSETPLSGFTMGAWNEIELDVTPSTTSGGGTLYLNGVKQGVTLTNSNLASWIGVSQILLGNTAWGSAIAGGQTIYFDDFIVAATTQAIGFVNVGTTGHVWSVARATDPKLINFSGAVGTPVADVSLITLANQFAWLNGKLSVYSAADPTSSVEVPSRQSAVTSAGASFITFSGLEFRGAQTYDVYCGNSVASCDHWDFEGDTFNAGYSNELYIQPYPGTNPAVLIVHQCTFKGGGSNGIALAGPGATGANITYNTLFDLSKVYNIAYSQNTWSDAIEGYSSNGADGMGSYIAYNNVYNIGVGVTQDYGGGIHADSVTGWTIDHNTVQNTNSAGIQLEKGPSLSAHYNLVVNGGQRLYGAGLMVRAGDGVSVYSADVEHNTLYGGWWACSALIQQNQGYVEMRNLVFTQNICDGASSGTQLYGDLGVVNSSNSLTGNAFGVPAPYFIVLGGQIVSTYWGLNAILGYTSNSISGDPLFTNITAGDFTLQSASPAKGVGAF